MALHFPRRDGTCHRAYALARAPGMLLQSANLCNSRQQAPTCVLRRHILLADVLQLTAGQRAHTTWAYTTSVPALSGGGSCVENVLYAAILAPSPASVLGITAHVRRTCDGHKHSNTWVIHVCITCKSMCLLRPLYSCSCHILSKQSHPVKAAFSFERWVAVHAGCGNGCGTRCI
jgi:hypothetical protein